MNLLSWNCRGLGNLRTVNALKEVINKEAPKIVFLMETKSNMDWMVMVRDTCEFKNGFFVDSNGTSGGLALLWKEEIRIDIQTYSPTHIDALLEEEKDAGWWHLTGFYGNPDTSKRSESWTKMKQLSHTSSLPWLVIGDFNELMGMSEKEGGSSRPRQQMMKFVEAIDYCRLKDIGFIGPCFTWLYMRRDGTQIRERLDRALATNEWTNRFPMAKLYHLTSSASDHSPLLLRFTNKVRSKKQRRMFRFEKMWLQDPRCKTVVLEAWKEGLTSVSEYPLVSCLERCRVRLDAWNKTEFGHVGQKIAALQKHLEWLELQPASPSMIQDMKNTRMELNGWHEKEDAMWFQRSRISWYQDGDRNTRFFHAKATARHKKNQMEGLLDSNGCWQDDEERMGEVVVDYYKELFTTSQPDDFTELLQALQPKVTPAMNQKLAMDFTENEVRMALKQMHPLKAPGPDDDSIIFCKATIKECNSLQKILEVYEKASGQQLNRTKTSLFFSRNTPEDMKEEIKNRFGAQVIRQHEKYLGLPSLVGRNKRSSFKEIKERLSKKLAGWKEKLLSKAGKEVLVKAVAQAIPTYTMNCFKIPDSLCDELTSLIRNFWWGQKQNERKMAWISWDKLCEPKAAGGMGFRQLKQFNLALLAKQGWRLQTMQNSLLYRLFKARYFPRTDFIHASLGTNPSYVWRSIMAAQFLVRQGSRWSVGKGTSIRIWGDKWLPCSTTYQVVSPRMFLNADTKVSELIDQDSSQWKAQVIDALFLPHEAECIKSIPLSIQPPEDRRIWAESANGMFTVRSAYILAVNLSRSANYGVSSDDSKMKKFWKVLWQIQAPHKVRHFIWRACRDILPTKTNLVRRKVINDDCCSECHEEPETSGHLFWSCPRAREVWSCTKLHFCIAPENIRSCFDLMWHMIMEGAYDESKVALVATLAWAMWGNRNEVRNGGKKKSGCELVQWTSRYLKEYYAALFRPATDTEVKVARWAPPPPDRYKINVDGAVFKAQKAAGIGVLIRDCHGQVIAAMSKKIKAPLGPLETEAKAVEAGLQFARDIGIQDCIFEGDSLTVFNAICGNSSPPSSVAAVVSGIKTLSCQLRRVDFSHVRRQCNTPAHLLAKHAKGIVDFIAWLEENPCFIEQSLHHDVLCLN